MTESHEQNEQTLLANCGIEALETFSGISTDGMDVQHLESDLCADKAKSVEELLQILVKSKALEVLELNFNSVRGTVYGSNIPRLHGFWTQNPRTNHTGHQENTQSGWRMREKRTYEAIYDPEKQEIRAMGYFTDGKSKPEEVVYGIVLSPSRLGLIDNLDGSQREPASTIDFKKLQLGLRQFVSDVVSTIGAEMSGFGGGNGPIRFEEELEALNNLPN
jgi:hypothetical protein